MTEEQIKKERAAFEDWYGADGFHFNEGNYINAEVNHAWNVWLAAKRHAEQSAWLNRDDTSEYDDSPEVIVQTERGDVLVSEAWIEDRKMCFLCEDELYQYGKVLYWQHLPSAKL